MQSKYTHILDAWFEEMYVVRGRFEPFTEAARGDAQIAFISIYWCILEQRPIVLGQFVRYWDFA